jgi:single-strand DNA-binding protein
MASAPVSDSSVGRTSSIQKTGLTQMDWRHSRTRFGPSICGTHPKLRRFRQRPSCLRAGHAAWLLFRDPRGCVKTPAGQQRSHLRHAPAASVLQRAAVDGTSPSGLSEDAGFKDVLRVEIIGHLGQDPEQRFNIEGVAMTTISVAVNARRRGVVGEYVDRTDWFRERTMGSKAEYVSRFVKGQRVLVVGRLEIGEYTARTTGERRISYDIWADDVVNLSPREDEAARKPDRTVGLAHATEGVAAGSSRPEATDVEAARVIDQAMTVLGRSQRSLDSCLSRNARQSSARPSTPPSSIPFTSIVRERLS